MRARELQHSMNVIRLPRCQSAIVASIMYPSGGSGLGLRLGSSERAHPCRDTRTHDGNLLTIVVR